AGKILAVPVQMTVSSEGFAGFLNMVLYATSYYTRSEASYGYNTGYNIYGHKIDGVLGGVLGAGRGFGQGAIAIPIWAATVSFPSSVIESGVNAVGDIMRGLGFQVPVYTGSDFSQGILYNGWITDKLLNYAG
ncbi:MAG TPA: hypothetical protein DHV62_10925, partial [Elusimicrobia bacterium]|nr:hypothetical protein [Elusimicrobiota bacterium]